MYPTKALNPALAAKASCALGNTNDTDSAAGGISPAALAALRDAPASCAVFPAHTPLGLRLVAALHARGAAHVTALVPSPAAAEAVAEAARAGALPRAAATATATAVVDPAAAADASGPAFDALKAALVRNGVTAVFFLAQQQQYSYYNLGIVDAADAATAAAEAEAEAAEEQEHDACYTSPVDAGDGDARAYADAAAQRVLRSPVLTPPHLRSHGSRAAATVRAAEGLLAAAAASAADAAAATGSANADASAAPLIAFVALTDPFAAAHCEGSFLAPDVSAATETAAALLHHASAGRGPSVGEAAGAQLMAEVRVLSENLKPAAKSALTAAVVAAPNVYGAGPADKALARYVTLKCIILVYHSALSCVVLFLPHHRITHPSQQAVILFSLHFASARPAQAAAGRRARDGRPHHVERRQRAVRDARRQRRARAHPRCRARRQARQGPRARQQQQQRQQH